MLDLKQLSLEINSKINDIKDNQSLENLRTSYLGKKGSITEAFKSLGSIDADKRKDFASELNQIKSNLLEKINKLQTKFELDNIEQKLSTAASAQNILLSLNALGYSGIWRTGKLAFNPFIASKLNLTENQEILGYLYVGTPDGTNKKIPELDIDDFVSYL